MRRLTALLSLVAVLALGPAGAAAAQQGGDTNLAEATATKNGSSVFDLAFSVREDSDGTVDQTNVASAYASCTSCSAVAIAFQIVLVYGSPTTVSPENAAIAVNENCQSCTATALAYQFVYGVPEGFELDDDDVDIEDFEEELEELEEEELTPEELEAEVAAIADELRNDLRAAIDSAPISEDGDDDIEDDDSDDDEDEDDEDED